MFLQPLIDVVEAAMWRLTKAIDFVASWRGLWSWNSYRITEGGSTTTRFKCQ